MPRLPLWPRSAPPAAVAGAGRRTHACAALCLIVLAMLAAVRSTRSAQAQAATHGQATGVSSMLLETDRTSSVDKQVVHLTAVLSGGLAVPTGTVTFSDGGNTIASAPLDSRGVAALGVAALKAGTHTLLAAYSGDAVYAPNASNAVAVTVQALPIAISVAAAAPSVATMQPLQVNIDGLPPAATGSVSVNDGGQVLTTMPIRGQTTYPYIALGDSITFGVNVPSSDTYPALFAAGLGLTVTDLGIPGTTACEMLSSEVLPSHGAPTQTYNPLYSLMIGTNDGLGYGIDPAYEVFFRNCHSAALAFLATPREYKVLSGDPGVTVLSGPWTYTGSLSDGTQGTEFNPSGAGTLQIDLTTSGYPIYLWYLIHDGIEGAFSLTVDGAAAGPALVETMTAGVRSNSNVGFGMLRLPVFAGAHTLQITALSGQVGILGAGTAPSPGGASTHPTVIVTDVPTGSPLPGGLGPDVVAAYSADVQADVTELTQDGLDLRLVSTHTLLTSIPANFLDYAHPSIAGHQLLAQTLATLAPGLVMANYASFANTVPAGPVTFTTAGTHSLAAAYGGDATYAPAASSPTAETVVLSPSTTTLLSAAATSFAQATLPLTATITPAAATGNVLFFDNGGLLGTVPVAAGGALLNVSALTPGPHTFTANYAGDQTYGASSSPAIQVQVNPNQSAVLLTGLPAAAAYGDLGSVAVTVTPATASGSVQVLDLFTAAGQSAAAALALGTAPLAHGQSTLPLPALAVGQHRLTAVYAGDPSDLGATSPVVTVSVTPLNSTTTLGAASARLAFGSAASLTATVSPAGVTGTVSFTDALTGQVLPATLGNGTAAVSIGGLGVGTHTFTASYAGDATHAASSSSGLTIEVDADTASVTMTTPANLTAGAALTLSASVLPAAATGSVTFRDQTLGVLGQAPVSSGAAVLTLPAPAAGSYSVIAAYGGDTADNPAVSAPVLFTVSQRAASVTLGSLPSTLTVGSTLNLSATVAPATATGTMTFTDSASGVLGTAVLNNGAAALSTSALQPGAHSITASYSGDAQDKPAVCGAQPLTVATSATTTTLTLAQPAAYWSAPALVSVRITSSPGVTPTGTVTVRSGATVMGTAAPGAQTGGAVYASFSIDTAPLAPGSYPLVAYYTGDADDSASDNAAAPVTLTVTAIPVSATLSLFSTQVPVGTPVTLTAALAAAPGAPALTPAGRVSFALNGAVFATAPVQTAGGVTSATATLPAQTIGSYSLGASFTPAGNFAAATAPAATLTVTAPLTLSLTSPAITAAAGTSATVPLLLTPLSGFSGAVSTLCVSPVTYMTCTVNSPASLNGTPANGSVSIAVAGSLSAAAGPARRWPGDGQSTVFAGMLLLLPLLARRRPRRNAGLLLICLLLSIPLAGCGGGNNTANAGVPARPETVIVTATAAGVSVSTSLTVQITH